MGFHGLEGFFALFLMGFVVLVLGLIAAATKRAEPSCAMRATFSKAKA